MTKQSATPYKTFLLAALLSAALLVCSCGRPATEKSMAVRHADIEKAMRTGSPSSPEIIASAMRAAADSMDYYECAAYMAKWYVLTSADDSAAALLDRTERFAARSGSARSRNLLGQVFNTRASLFHYNRTETDSSITLYKKAYTMWMQNGNEADAPKACANLADAYVFKNNLPAAAACYRRALFLTDSLGLPYAENLSLYLGLASIYRQLGDFRRAQTLYENADRHFNEMTEQMQSYFLNNYASFFYYRKNYPASLRVFRRLEAFLKSKGSVGKGDLFLCRLNLADVYLNLGNTGEAERLLDEVEPFWKQTGNKTALYYCATIRLGIAVSRGDRAAAAAIIRESGLRHPEMEHDMVSIRNSYVRRYFALCGNWHSAYRYLLAERREDDSLSSSLTGMRAADIMNQYQQDTLRLHNSMVLAQKDAEVRLSRLWLVAAVAAVLLMLAAVLYILYMAKQRRLQSELQIMRLKLEGARGKISPHFIFNVLNNHIAGLDDDSARTCISDLARLIRSSLDMTCCLAVSLRDELDFVRKYVSVESRQLVDDDFNFTIGIAAGIDADKVTVPSMFIQIMVENAFVHGLMGRTGSKVLAVDVSRCGGGCRVAVTDNGPGFSIHGGGKKRTGLNVICQTMKVINASNRHKMTFGMHNIDGADGHCAGCRAELFIPDDIKYPEWNENRK